MCGGPVVCAAYMLNLLSLQGIMNSNFLILLKADDCMSVRPRLAGGLGASQGIADDTRCGRLGFIYRIGKGFIYRIGKGLPYR
jgi:hypothetical protein